MKFSTIDSPDRDTHQGVMNMLNLSIKSTEEARRKRLRSVIRGCLEDRAIAQRVALGLRAPQSH